MLDVNKLTASSLEAIEGMIEHCLNHGIALGMDEGFDDEGNSYGDRVIIEQAMGLEPSTNVYGQK